MEIPTVRPRNPPTWGVEEGAVSISRREVIFTSWEVKGKFGNNFPNTGREVSMEIQTSQVMGKKILNDHQLPIFGR